MRVLPFVQAPCAVGGVANHETKARWVDAIEQDPVYFGAVGHH
jgi:hypothetical protein